MEGLPHKWKLPGDLSLFIRHHHGSAPPGAPSHVGKTVDVVRLADWVSVALLRTRDWESLDDDALRARVDGAPLPTSGFWSERVLGDVRGAMAESEKRAALLGL